MRLVRDGDVAEGFVAYVHDVARCLGVCPEDSTQRVEVDADSFRACIAVPPRLVTSTSQDLALRWEEDSGWAVTIEPHPLQPPIPLAYHGGNPLPPPSEVSSFVRHLLAGRPAGQLYRPAFGSASEDALRGLVPDSADNFASA